MAALPLMTKADQDLSADKGSQTKYRFGALSGSHLDGIGGGHLVRDLETDLEQGLGSPVVVVSPSKLYGRPVLFPRKISSDQNKFGYLAELSKRSLADDVERYFGGDFDFGNKKESPFKESKLIDQFGDSEEKDFSDSKRKRQMDSIGGGHLLGKKNLNENQKLVRDNLSLDSSSRVPKRLDYLGGGHLLAAKREMDALGGGHLLKRLDSLGGGHLLAAKREMDSLGGGHLLKRLDALGGGHLLSSKRNVPSLYESPFHNLHVSDPSLDYLSLICKCLY